MGGRFFCSIFKTAKLKLTDYVSCTNHLIDIHEPYSNRPSTEK